MITRDEFDSLRQTRRSGLAALHEELSGLEDALRQLREAVDDGLPEASTTGVSVAFDGDGVLREVRLDEKVRAALGPEELQARLRAAFATGPVPARVLAALRSDPERLRGLREERSAGRPRVIESARLPIRLATVAGRPIELRADAQALAAVATPDLEEEIVHLAQRAVDAESAGAA